MQVGLRVLGICSFKAFLSIHRFVELIDDFFIEISNESKDIRKRLRLIWSIMTSFFL